ncbi:MAG TPA: AI-2E family transporter [Candidatus Acidoferrales bacterium]|nr:AI-2E family transporter [Candidatus Acidoferrales bacterium]
MTIEQSSQKRIGTALFYGIVILLVYLVYLVFAPFLVPLAWAAVLVVVSYPAYERLARRGNRTTAALAATAAVTLILIVPTLLVMIAFVRQGVNAVQSVQMQVANGHFTWVNDLWVRIQHRFPEAGSPDLARSLRRYGEQAGEFVAAELGNILRNTALFLFHLGVTILAMFYLYRDGDSIVERLREVLPFESAQRERMLRDARSLIFASVTSSLVAAAAHGALGGTAFALTGIRAPIFWGVMMGFFSFVPLVGSALIWVPVSISLMAGGHLARGIILAVFCSVIVGLVDNLIRPWLISGRAEMGGLVVFISVLGGIAVFGMLGVVLGPIVVATAASVLDLYAPVVHAGNTASHAGAK